MPKPGIVAQCSVQVVRVVLDEIFEQLIFPYFPFRSILAHASLETALMTEERKCLRWKHMYLPDQVSRRTISQLLGVCGCVNVVGV